MSTDPAGELNRDPEDWKTGGEPITEAQKSYLQTLATEAGVDVGDVDSLTKAEASEKIDELQDKSGRKGEPS